MKKVSKIELLKTAAALVVSVGVGAIVGNAVKHTTPSDVKQLAKACIKLGSFVLTGVVGDMAAKYTEDKIDSAVSTVKDLVLLEKENKDENIVLEEA